MHSTVNRQTFCVDAICRTLPSGMKEKVEIETVLQST